MKKSKLDINYPVYELDINTWQAGAELCQAKRNLS